MLAIKTANVDDIGEVTLSLGFRGILYVVIEQNVMSLFAT